MINKRICIILMFFLALSLASAAPVINLESPPDNYVSTTNSITFSYNVTNSANIENCSLLISESTNKTSASITLNQSLSITQTLADNDYNWSISCTDINGLTGAASSFIIKVDSTYPSVILNSPANNLRTNDSSVDFSYTPTDTNLKNCSLYGNFSGTWQQNITNTSPTSESSDIFSVNIPDGSHIWNIKCFDEKLSSFGSSNLTLMIDTSAPSITSYSPVNTVTTEETTLSITTNENATCKYSTNSSKSFINMSKFSTTGLKSHTQTISGLSDGSYNYYIKCNDTLGNIMISNYHIIFDVSLLPTAEVTLSDESPVKAGTIEVTLVTSRSMKSTPTLKYSFDDAPSAKKEISLTGSDSLWEGYMVIVDKDEKKIGTFYFSGTDKSDYTGTVVANGKLFIVDTIEPKKPTNVEGSSEKDGKIKLKWHTDDDDLDHYNIYRSTSSNINVLDYYGEANISSYSDRSTIDKVTYYYKIAAVDKAGNIGPLSDEIYVTSVKEGSTTEIEEEEESNVAKVLPPNLVIKVNDYIKTLESLKIDLDGILVDFEEISDIKIKEIIDELNLEDDIGLKKEELARLKAKLENLRLSYSSEDELDKKISGIDLDVKKIRTTTIKSIELIENTEFIQDVSKEDIEIAVDELFENVDFGDIDKKGYVSKNGKKQKDIKVEINIWVVNLEYLDSTKKDKTLFQKKITNLGSDALKDVMLIEIIPKSIAENADDIKFLSSDYEVLKKDPIIKFGFVEIGSDGKEIKYTLDKRIDIEEGKTAKSVVLLGPTQLNIGPGKITGLSIISFENIGFSKVQNVFMWIGLIMIISLTIYYLGFIKYDVDFSILPFFKEKTQISKVRNAIVPAGMKTHDSEDVYELIDTLYKNIKNIREESAKKLHPLVTSIYKNLEKNKDNDNTVRDLHNMIDKAVFYLENKQQHLAMKLYPKIESIYENLPKELKNEVYDKCVDLHKRINKIIK